MTDNKTSRWLVELAPHARQDIGQFEDVGADGCCIQDGCLVFLTDGEITYMRAAGTWLTVCPGED